MANRNNDRPLFSTGATGILVLVACAALAFMMWGCPNYNVWRAEKAGQAQLAEAKYSKLTRVEEANANLEAEKLNALAEIERAKGAAEAIKIENGSLTYTYILYLWVRQQNNLNNRTVVYIPTGKAGLPDFSLPVTEANRLGTGPLLPDQ